MKVKQVLVTLASLALVSARAVSKRDINEHYHVQRCLWENGSQRQICHIDQSGNKLQCNDRQGSLAARWRIDRCQLNEAGEPAGLDANGKIMVMPNTDPIYAESDWHERDVSDDEEDADQPSTISPYAADCGYLDPTDGEIKVCAASADEIVCAPPDRYYQDLDQARKLTIPMCLLNRYAQPAGLDAEGHVQVDGSKRMRPVVNDGIYGRQNQPQQPDERSTRDSDCDWLDTWDQHLNNCYVTSRLGRQFKCVPYPYSHNPFASQRSICALDGEGGVKGVDPLDGQMLIWHDYHLRQTIYRTWNETRLERQQQSETSEAPVERVSILPVPSGVLVSSPTGTSLVDRALACDYYNPDTEVTLTCFGSGHQIFCVPRDYFFGPGVENQSYNPACKIKPDGRLADLDADGNVQLAEGSTEQSGLVKRGEPNNFMDALKDAADFITDKVIGTVEEWQEQTFNLDHPGHNPRDEHSTTTTQSGLEQRDAPNFMEALKKASDFINDKVIGTVEQWQEETFHLDHPGHHPRSADATLTAPQRPSLAERAAENGAEIWEAISNATNYITDTVQGWQEDMFNLHRPSHNPRAAEGSQPGLEKRVDPPSSILDAISNATNYITDTVQGWQEDIFNLHRPGHNPRDIHVGAANALFERAKPAKREGEERGKGEEEPSNIDKVHEEFEGIQKAWDELWGIGKNGHSPRDDPAAA